MENVVGFLFCGVSRFMSGLKIVCLVMLILVVWGVSEMCSGDSVWILLISLWCSSLFFGMCVFILGVV